MIGSRHFQFVGIMTVEIDITVFFSWQSDLPQEQTTKAIRRALRAAASEIELTHSVHIKLDEATRNVSGAVYIPAEIARKIEVADIVIADITTVARTQSGKSLPNANVTFELGLSVAHLGWSRNILLFNKDLEMLENLPFDFDRHRISTYEFTNEVDQKKKQDGDLKKLLGIALEQIIADNPKRPSELRVKSESEIRRERDIANINWFMRQISTGSIDFHIKHMPYKLHEIADYMHSRLDAVVNRADFRLYDEETELLMRSVYLSLSSSLRYPQYYREAGSGGLRLFGRRSNPSFAEEDAESVIANEISKAIHDLNENVKLLLARLRYHYIEVDFDESSRLLLKEYKEFAEEMN